MGRLDNHAGRHGTDEDRDSPWNLPRRRLPYYLFAFAVGVGAAFVTLIAQTPRDHVGSYLFTTVLPGTGSVGLGLMVMIVAVEGLLMGAFRKMLEREREKGRQEQHDRWEEWRKKGGGASPAAPPGTPPRNKDDTESSSK